MRTTQGSQMLFGGNSIKWRHVSRHVVVKRCPLFHSLPSSESLPRTALCVEIREHERTQRGTISFGAIFLSVQQMAWWVGYHLLHLYCNFCTVSYVHAVKSLPTQPSISCLLQIPSARPNVIRFALQSSKSEGPSHLVGICSGITTLHPSPRTWTNVSNGANQ